MRQPPDRSAFVSNRASYQWRARRERSPMTRSGGQQQPLERCTCGDDGEWAMDAGCGPATMTDEPRWLGRRSQARSRKVHRKGGSGSGGQKGPNLIIYEWDLVFMQTAAGHDLGSYSFVAEDQCHSLEPRRKDGRLLFQSQSSSLGTFYNHMDHQQQSTICCLGALALQNESS